MAKVGNVDIVVMGIKIAVLILLLFSAASLSQEAGNKEGNVQP
jgi:hypothetical protein